MWREVLEDSRNCFSEVEGPRGLGFGADVALSSGMLATQQALRGLSSHYTSPNGAFGVFVINVLEVFDDAHVYATLQYREVLERYRQRLERNPGDGAARIELARTLIKCGLYHDAIRELEIARGDARIRAQALHELSVASFRAGRFTDAGSYAREAMELNGSHGRTRAAALAGGAEGQRLRAGRPGGDAHAAASRASGRRAASSKTSRQGSAWTRPAAGAARRSSTTTTTAGSISPSLRRTAAARSITTTATARSPMSRSAPGWTCRQRLRDRRRRLRQRRFIRTSSSRASASMRRRGQLFHNNGDGTFTDVTEQAGPRRSGDPAFTASWVDYDCDGRLDLFVANNLGGLFERKTPNRLFHNNGDGTFTEVTEQAGLETDLADNRIALGRLRQRRPSGSVRQQRPRPVAAVPQQRRRHVHRCRPRSRRRHDTASAASASSSTTTTTAGWTSCSSSGRITKT